MNVTSSDIAITIILPETSVAQLMETLTSLASGSFPVEEKASASESTPKLRQDSREPISPRTADQPKKYTCEILGTVLAGSTLPEVFTAVVDLMDDLDPAVLEKLSMMRPSYDRNYISRTKEKVHIRSPWLETLRTESGWWTSKNIGRLQLIGALQALCRAAGLEYGKDMRFL